MLLLKILALLATIATGGAIQSQLGHKKWAKRFANIVALVGAFYLARDIWYDLVPFFPTRPPAEIPTSPPTPDVIVPAPKPIVPEPKPTVPTSRPLYGIDWLSASFLFSFTLLSGLVAMYRGAAREVLSVVSWVAAGGAAVYVVRSSWLGELVAGMTLSGMTLWRIAVSTVAFLLVLICVHLVTSHISDAVLDSRIGALDRIFGLLYGIARACIFVPIAYSLAASILGHDFVYGPSPTKWPLSYLVYFDESLRAMIRSLV